MRLDEAFQADIAAAIRAKGALSLFPRVKYYEYVPVVTADDPLGLGVVVDNQRRMAHYDADYSDSAGCGHANGRGLQVAAA